MASRSAQINDPRPILVVGAGGMLGNALLHQFTQSGMCATGTLRRRAADASWFAGLSLIEDIDLLDSGTVERAVYGVRPRWIINCAAVRGANACDAKSVAIMEAINTHVPHRLARVADRVGAQLIHISTDGVFNGAGGPYNENSLSSPLDPYGRSKLAGEVEGDHVLTIRLSLVGRSPSGRGTLVDWLLGLPPSAEISGYTRAVFSGLPVSHVGHVLTNSFLEQSIPPGGLVHLPGPPISKAALIRLILDRAGRRDVLVRDDPTVVIDRTLRSVRSPAFVDQSTMSWPRLIDEMFDFYAQRGIAD